MAPHTVPHDTVPRCVAAAALSHALARLADVTEERNTWRDLALAAIHRLARQTGIVTSQTATIRRMSAELRGNRQAAT
jgi:hypothetical protein